MTCHGCERHRLAVAAFVRRIIPKRPGVSRASLLRLLSPSSPRDRRSSTYRRNIAGRKDEQ